MHFAYIIFQLIASLQEIAPICARSLNKEDIPKMILTTRSNLSNYLNNSKLSMISMWLITQIIHHNFYVV